MTLDPAIDAYYAAYGEATRLDHAVFQLERERTREVLERHLPRPPAVVLDVGGGAGAYALWLARKGYRVHLVDPVALHVTQAWSSRRRSLNTAWPAFPSAMRASSSRKRGAPTSC